jgi:hypothetical protein
MKSQRRLVATLTALFVLVAIPHLALGHDGGQGSICPEGGEWSSHLGGETVESDWGEAIATDPSDPEPGTVTYEVNDGYVVEFCLKAGNPSNPNQDDGHEHHTITGPAEGTLTAPANKQLSHWSYRVVEPETEDTTPTTDPKAPTTTAEVENTTITTGPTTTTDPGETTTTVEETLGSTIATSTTTDEVSASTLPFTGSEGMVPLAASAAALLLLGMAVLRRA